MAGMADQECEVELRKDGGGDYGGIARLTQSWVGVRGVVAVGTIGPVGFGASVKAIVDNVGLPVGLPTGLPIGTICTNTFFGFGCKRRCNSCSLAIGGDQVMCDVFDKKTFALCQVSLWICLLNIWCDTLDSTGTGRKQS
jgi:hypothetical protein